MASAWSQIGTGALISPNWSDILTLLFLERFCHLIISVNWPQYDLKKLTFPGRSADLEGEECPKVLTHCRGETKQAFEFLEILACMKLDFGTH